MLVQKELKNAYIWIPNPTSIVLDKSSISLTTIWQTEQLTATIEPTVSDHSITWSSDDTTVATVSTTGLVTCVTPWTCTITATTVNGLTATCNVGAAQIISVDFRELSALPSDWIASTWGTVVYGSWLKWDSAVYKAIDLTGASKIKMTMTWNRTKTSWAWWDNIWLASAINGDMYVLWAAYNSNYSYNSGGSYIWKRVWGTETQLWKVTWQTPQWWDYTYIFELDFNTWVTTTSQYDSMSGYTNTPTYTLTASELATIKSYGYIYIYVYAPNGITNYAHTISIEIS